MNLLAGIDEAGYGPTLGPLVVTRVALQIEGDDPWTALAPVVAVPGGRGKKADGDEPLWVGDSKQVYSGPRGMQRLERTVLAFTALATGSMPESANAFLEACCVEPPQHTLED